LKDQQSGDILVFGGGIIPKDDIDWLKERGIREVFTPGASTEDIISWVKAHIFPKS
jgi:methylmalonyl-CoA mutase C-terminal domain/subunit